MGCSFTKNTDPLESSGPLHFDNDLVMLGPEAPFLDKLAYTAKAYVVSVYDGDTFTVAMRAHGPAHNSIVRVKCRLQGIDTPEMRPPKAQENRDEEIAKAKAAKKFVQANILNKHLQLNVAGQDKYGRLLVSVACPDTGLDLTTLLIGQGHGYKYDGGTKHVFEG